MDEKETSRPILTTEVQHGSDKGPSATFQDCSQ